MNKAASLPDSMRSKFIAFEGIDGSGKSTQVQRLAETFRSADLAVHVTREPSDGPIGNMIRQGMTGRIDLDDRVIAALFAADRIDHLTNSCDGILGLLKAGTTVITDRYYLSSYAYHQEFTGFDWVVAANSIAVDLLQADLTIYLDINPEVAIDRLSRDRSKRERYEEVERLRTVSDAYQRALKNSDYAGEIVVIDAASDADSVEAAVWKAVADALG